MKYYIMGIMFIVIAALQYFLGDKMMSGFNSIIGNMWLIAGFMIDDLKSNKG